jgi:ketosteroid isomerase-like protein
MQRILVALVLCAVSLSSVAQVSPDEQRIRDLRAASNRAIRASQIQQFAASLAPDFVVVTGNGSFLTREAYLAAFARDFNDPHSVRFERTVDSIDLSSSLPLAAEHGHWTGSIPGGPVLFRGTYLAMWRKSPGGWQLRSELFVSLSCADAQACESYRHRYAASPPSR